MLDAKLDIGTVETYQEHPLTMILRVRISSYVFYDLIQCMCSEGSAETPTNINQ